MLLFLVTITVAGQTFNNFKIVEKGNFVYEKCSGVISERLGLGLFGEITITLSDMLEQKFIILEKEQIDERTIRYKCQKIDLSYDIKRYDIIKQKCNINESVYFFSFPPLYDGNKTTIYKTIK